MTLIKKKFQKFTYRTGTLKAQFGNIYLGMHCHHKSNDILIVKPDKRH